MKRRFSPLIFQLLVVITAGCLQRSQLLVIGQLRTSAVAVWAFGIALWAAVIGGCAIRLRRLRRVVWCVKLSDREVVGYDYARRRMRIDWIDAERLELGEHGLAVVGPSPCVLEVPHLFPEFATLSHRMVRYAEFYEIPIFVGGQPWQQLDVYHLYPFLTETTSPDHPPSTHGSA